MITATSVQQPEKSAAKTNVNCFDAFPIHRLMTFAAALNGGVLLALVAFDLLLNNFYFPYKQ